MNIPLFGIYHDEAMEQAAGAVLRSGQIASGPLVAQFEQAVAALAGQAHVVAVSDMSTALQIALRMAGVEPGDEVLTSAYACLSTNAPIAIAGARARWVDVDPATGGMDPEALRRAITPRSKVVVAYHLAGYPLQIEAIAAICREHGLQLIEDCNNALLATVGGRPVGSWGDYAIYSFYPNRQINASEGGAVACRDAEGAARARRLRRYGIEVNGFRDRWGEISPESQIVEIGLAAPFNQLCASLGLSQLGGVAERVAISRRHAALMGAQLEGLPGLSLVPATPGAEPAYWTLLLRLQERNRVMYRLKSIGVQCSTLHLRSDSYIALGGPAELSGTQAFAAQVLAVPCGWWLSDAQVANVVNQLQAVLLGQRT